MRRHLRPEIWRVLEVAILALAACDGHLASGDDASSLPDATSDACASSFACADTSYDASPSPLPAPVLCPSMPPEAGMPCDQPDYEDCEYGTSSNYLCNQHFACTSGGWWPNTTDSFFCKKDVDCASAMDGIGCTSPGQICPMEDAGVVCVCSECSAGPPPPSQDGAPNAGWQCFAPGPGCNIDRPVAGTSCDLPDGSTCRYNSGSCCRGVDEQCVDNVWVGWESSPCP